MKVGTMVGGLAATVVSGQQAETQHDEPPIQTLERYSESLLASLESAERGQSRESLSEDYVSPWPSMPGSLSTLRDLSSQYLLAKEGTLGFVLLRLAKEEASISITLAHVRPKLRWRGPEPSDASLDGSSPRKSIFGWNTKSGGLRALLDGSRLCTGPSLGLRRVCGPLDLCGAARTQNGIATAAAPDIGHC